MRVFGLFLILILSFSIQNVFAEQNPLTLETDKKNYSQGDIIHITGRVAATHFGSDVSLMILSPEGDIISIKKLAVNDKKFEVDIVVDKAILHSTGVYSFLARYGSETDLSLITVTYNTSQSFLAPDDPEKNILLNFDFVKPSNKAIQEHVDYKITISSGGADIYGPTSITHSSSGSVSLPLVLKERQTYDVRIEVYGVLFQQSPMEVSSFKIMSGTKTVQSEFTSKDSLKINLAINKDPSPEPKIIPEWVKNNAKWWALGQIDDDSFVQAVSYLLQNKIVVIQDLPYPASWMDKNVPDWVKNNASWWADDLIQEDDFIKGIKFLVEKGVIQINPV